MDEPVPELVGVIGGGRMGAGIARDRVVRGLQQAEYLQSRFAPPQLLRDTVARGELGRKTGQGFYPWTE